MHVFIVIPTMLISLFGISLSSFSMELEEKHSDISHHSALTRDTESPALSINRPSLSRSPIDHRTSMQQDTPEQHISELSDTMILTNIAQRSNIKLSPGQADTVLTIYNAEKANGILPQHALTIHSNHLHKEIDLLSILVKTQDNSQRRLRHSMHKIIVQQHIKERMYHNQYTQLKKTIRCDRCILGLCSIATMSVMTGILTIIAARCQQ